uniref:Uncharacterized protein n=1 Tax=Anguilla anguilla TaxID=7936 RepID=A0A0E9R5P5_ANGAN
MLVGLLSMILPKVSSYMQPRVAFFLPSP